MIDSAEIIDLLDAVPSVEMCACGKPRGEHSYWEDRIYDYNGYRCPGSVGGEYRFDAVFTRARHRQARADVLASVRGVCQWAIDDVGGDSVYETRCGHSFEFTSGGPIENGFQFCGYCGGRLVGARTSSEPGELSI